MWNCSWKRKFYLVGLEAFAEPMVVIPDVGGKRNACFHMKSRQLWVEQFEQWVKDPHRKLQMDGFMCITYFRPYFCRLFSVFLKLITNSFACKTSKKCSNRL